MAASAGLSRIEAINRILRAWGMGRISTADSSGSWPSLTYGTSDAGEAESILDEVCAEVLSERWDGPNCDYYKSFTTDASQNITLGEAAGNILKVRGAGSLLGRVLSIRGGLLWDNVGNTNQFGTQGTTIYLDVLRNIAFEELDPHFKSYVVNRAVEYARNAKMPDELRAQIMARDVARAESVVDTNSPGRAEPPYTAKFPGMGYGARAER